MPYFLKIMFALIGLTSAFGAVWIVAVLFGDEPLAELFKNMALATACAFALFSATAGIYITCRPVIPNTMIHDLMYLGYSAFNDSSLEFEQDGMQFGAIKATKNKDVMRKAPASHIRQLLTYRLSRKLLHGNGKNFDYVVASGKTDNGLLNMAKRYYVNIFLGEEILDSIDKERSLYASGQFTKNAETIYPLASYIFAEIDFTQGKTEPDWERVSIFYNNAASLEAVFRLRGLPNEAIENLAMLPDSYLNQIVPV